MPCFIVTNVMIALARQRLRELGGNQCACFGLLVLFLSALCVANSATLHGLLHVDAGKPGHECAATLLAQGQFAPPPAIPVIPAVVPVVTPAVTLLARNILVAEDYTLLPGRAPPASPY